MMPPKDTITTGNLFLMVENSDDITAEWDGISEHMNAPAFHEYLSEIISEKGIDAAELGLRTLLSRSFTYQICSGDRIPGRDIILRIALTLELSVDVTQRMLRLAGRGALYPRIKRDSVIIFALANKYGIYKTDETLSRLGQETLL